MATRVSRYREVGGSAGSAGPRNLMAASRVAVDPAVRGLGVRAVLNDEIHSARSAMKAHMTALSASARRVGAGRFARR